MLLGSGGHFLLESAHQAAMNIGRNGLGFEAFVNLDRSLRGVENNPAIGAFFDVFVQGGPNVGVQRIVQEVD